MMVLGYNMMIKKILIPILALVLLVLLWWGFLSFGIGKWYTEYTSEWEYRRLHPEFIPSPILVKTFDMWHSTSYASFIWLELIQYIGDNVGGNRFLNFSHTLLNHITILHPYFIRPYEIDLILAPTSLWENLNAESKKQNQIFANSAIELWKKGITTLCNAEKIWRIKQKSLWTDLWNDISLKNPCASGMIPYYIAFVTYQMGSKKSDSAEYYKIASMNDDAPSASWLLWILSLSSEWDYRATAMNFALIGSNGYDIDPYICRNITTRIVQDINNKRILDKAWFDQLQREESTLKDNIDPKNLVSTANDNCYEMANRSIEALYLNYIADIANGTQAKNGNDLIRLGLMKIIPTISRKSGYTVRKKGITWEYQSTK
jgi:hypothetical protein